MAKPSRDHIDKFYEYGLNLETRTLCLIGDVDDEFYGRAIRGLHLLRASGNTPVTIYLNSEGGSWDVGVAVYDFIRHMPFEVTIEVWGTAQSMGSVILQAADRRLLAPHAVVMVHHGTDRRDKDQHTVDYERWADHSRKIREQMCQIYARRSGQKAAYWQRKCQHDYILSAEQAIAEGLADAII